MSSFESIEHLIGARYEDVFEVGINNGVDFRIDGGDGSDWLDYSTTYDTVGVTVDLEKGVATGIGAEGEWDSVLNIENVSGTRFDDDITGDGGPNILVGLDGLDTLAGAGGDDELYGGNDDDILLGGDGVDQLFGQDGMDFLDGGDDEVQDILVGGLHSDTFVRYRTRWILMDGSPFDGEVEDENVAVEDENVDFDPQEDLTEDVFEMPF